MGRGPRAIGINSQQAPVTTWDVTCGTRPLAKEPFEQTPGVIHGHGAASGGQARSPFPGRRAQGERPTTRCLNSKKKMTHPANSAFVASKVWILLALLLVGCGSANVTENAPTPAQSGLTVRIETTNPLPDHQFRIPGSRPHADGP